MRIVFGHSHFRIKKVQPHEVGLFDKEFNNITFDLQQKYAHLYWIPFFPLGKIWTVNKGDGKKYVCHPQIEQMLDQTPGRSGKKAIFAWSGFLAIALGFLIFSVSMKVEAYNTNKAMDRSFRENAASLNEMVDSLSTDDYVMMKMKKPGEVYYSTATPLKIMAVRNDEVQLGYYDVEDFDLYSGPDNNSAMIKFLEENTINASFWVKKSLLRQGIIPERAEENSFKGISFAIKPGIQYQVSDVKHLAGPEIEEDYAAPGKSETYFELINTGFDAHADSLVPSSDSLLCKLSKKRDFKTDSSIAVQLFSKGAYVLYLSDTAKRTYAYQLENYDNRLLITKL